MFLLDTWVVISLIKGITYTFEIANKMAHKSDAKMAPQYGRINGNIDAI